MMCNRIRKKRNTDFEAFFAPPSCLPLFVSAASSSLKLSFDLRLWWWLECFFPLPAARLRISSSWNVLKSSDRVHPHLSLSSEERNRKKERKKTWRLKKFPWRKSLRGFDVVTRPAEGDGPSEGGRRRESALWCFIPGHTNTAPGLLAGNLFHLSRPTSCIFTSL